MRQAKITLSPLAKAQVEKSFVERTIAEAWREVEGHLPCYEARAEYAVGSLEEAGFQIARKPSDQGLAASGFPKSQGVFEAALEGVIRALGHDDTWDVEVDDIVKEVSDLRNIVGPITEESDRRTEHMTFDEDSDSWTVTGTGEDVQMVLDLIGEAEAARKLARASASRGTSIETISGTIDLPRYVARVTVATDTTPDGTNVCTFGWSDSGAECWLLNHTFVPSPRAAA